MEMFKAVLASIFTSTIVQITMCDAIVVAWSETILLGLNQSKSYGELLAAVGVVPLWFGDEPKSRLSTRLYA